MNVKPKEQRRENHINLYVSDADLNTINNVKKYHPGTTLDKIILHALRKVYGKSYSEDYQSILLQQLSEEKDRLNQDIETMTKEIERKKRQVKEIEENIDQLSGPKNVVKEESDNNE